MWKLHRLILLGCMIWMLVSCRGAEDVNFHTSVDPTPSVSPTPLLATETNTHPDNRWPVLVETFSDSSKIGRPGKNKIEIELYESRDTHPFLPDQLAVIRFYSRGTEKNWILTQTFEVESHSINGIGAEFGDFNKDNFKDLTLISNTAARLSNKVQTLLIYDAKRDELIRIRNSEDYPNLLYNRRLNCIDSMIFTGSATTVFLRLNGDLLREFASVSTGIDLVATVTGEDGTEREIFRKPMHEDDVYTRYIDYDPPTPYK